MEPAIPFPASALQEALYWGKFFADEWRQDMPSQMYSSALGEDGTPEQWTKAFSEWIGNAPGDEERHRTTVVMRRLRRVAPREYEVLWRVFFVRETIEEVTVWLNERAERNNIPLPPGRDVWYRPKDCVALMLAGISYAQAYW